MKVIAKQEEAKASSQDDEAFEECAKLLNEVRSNFLEMAAKLKINPSPPAT
jgi:hypothetical protein